MGDRQPEWPVALGAGLGEWDEGWLGWSRQAGDVGRKDTAQ